MKEIYVRTKLVNGTYVYAPKGTAVTYGTVLIDNETLQYNGNKLEVNAAVLNGKLNQETLNKLQAIENKVENIANAYVIDTEKTYNFAEYNKYKKPDDTIFNSQEDLVKYLGANAWSLNNLFKSSNDQIALHFKSNIETDINNYIICEEYEYYKIYKISDLIDKINIGDNFYVKQQNVPDRWVESFSSYAAGATIILNAYESKKQVTNLIDGTGVGSLVQKRLKSDGVTWTTAKAYQGAGIALGGGTQAGRTEEEFNAYFWDSTKNVPLNGGKGKDSQGNILDNNGLTYAKSYSFALAEGESTKAFGRSSHAEGNNTQAIGIHSHSEGLMTTANGYIAHAEGQYTQANGAVSHAEGDSTKSEGIGSHAEGNNTTSSGKYSHSEGYNTTSSNEYAHSEGHSTIASGLASHAEGLSTKAEGYATHTEGAYTEAYYTGSHAEGNHTKTYREYQHVGGTYNYYKNNALYIVGNGTSDNDRKNAFEVLEDGRAKVQSAPTENDDVVRKLELDKTWSEFNLKNGTGIGSLVQKTVSSSGTPYANESSGSGSVAMGKKVKSKGNATFVIGQENEAIAGTSASFTSGRLNINRGSYNITGGENNANNNSWNLVIGKGNAVSDGRFGIVSGLNNVYTGPGDYKNTTVSMLGNKLYAQSENQPTNGALLIGQYNKVQNNSGRLFIVGNGTSKDDRKNAFEVLQDGRAKVYGEPVNDEDVVRKKELSKLYKHSIWIRFPDGSDVMYIYVTGLLPHNTKINTIALLKDNSTLLADIANVQYTGLQDDGGGVFIGVYYSGELAKYMLSYKFGGSGGSLSLAGFTLMTDTVTEL